MVLQSLPVNLLQILRQTPLLARPAREHVSVLCSLNYCSFLIVFPNFVVCGTVPEYKSLTLVAKTGFVFSQVVFASFGTPSGGCNSFQLGSCNSRFSANNVSSLCVGLSSCTIPATIDFFGGVDPCPKVNKQLSVQLAQVQGLTNYLTFDVFNNMVFVLL